MIIHSPKIITDGLVLALDAGNTKSFSGGASTAWNDLSTTKNNGTINGSPTFNSDKRGYLNFDGVNDYVDFGNILSYSSGGYSFCIWFNFNDLADFDNTLFRKGNNYHVYIRSPGSWRFAYFRNTGASVTTSWSSGPISINTWNFMTMVKNGSDIDFYIFRPSSTMVRVDLKNQIDPQTNSDNLYLGYDGSTQYSNIKIASLLNYNRALSTSEVLQNFECHKTRFNL